MNRSIKLVLCVRRDLKMGKGKVAAQCVHAAMGALRVERKDYSALVQEWERTPARKVVTLKIKNLEQLETLIRDAVLTDTNYYTQVDLGLTQIAPNTKTVLALGPDYDMRLDNLTKGLKLY